MGRWDNLCPGCFGVEITGPVCSRCGFDEREKSSPLALKARTCLNKQYVVGRILGKIGGFGITYLGWDTRLETRVAIKEYLPRDLACRDADRSTVVPHSEDDRELFQYGFQQFMEEARTLAKFDHFNIVRVRNFFEENGTAYLVMDYYEGMTLTEYLRSKGGHIPEKLAVEIMMRVLDGLREVHSRGFLHRDIKPHNIYLAQGGRPILLDFGAARFAVGERTRSLSVLLTPGFAPPEQYHRKGSQGPWTDIYACGATLYQMLTGSAPPEALERASDGDLRFPEKTAPSISPGIRRTLNQALAIVPEKRPQTAKDFQDTLTLGLLDETPKPQAAPPPPHPPKLEPKRDLHSSVAPTPFRPKLNHAVAKEERWHALAKVYLALFMLCSVGFVTLLAVTLSPTVSSILPVPHKLVALHLRHNDRDVSLPPGSQLIVNPRDAIGLTRVQTDALVSWGTELTASGLDVSPMLRGPVVIRELMPQGSFETPNVIGIQVLSWGRPIGQVFLLVQLDADDWLQKANAASSVEQKIACLEKALNENPGNVLVKTQLAGVYFDNTRYDPAAKLYEEIDESNRSKVILERLLLAYQARNRVDEALKTYLNLLKLSEDPETFKEFLQYLQKHKSRDHAAKFLENHQHDFPQAFQGMARHASNTGSVKVDSKPVGAAVHIDGEERGKAPMNVESLPPGKVTVRATLEGYRPQEKTVEVRSGKEVQARFLLDREEKRAEPKPGEIWREPVTGMEFVWVPGGCYQMGCGSWVTYGCRHDDQKPLHEVCVDGFWIGRTEVTQGQWQKLMGNNPSGFQRGDDYPVEQVSWVDAKHYVKKLNGLRNVYRFRLPTEAEWEYACRSRGKDELYAGGSDAEAVAWHEKNSGGSTHPVGKKRGNGLGLYDMSGNVWEWVEDVYRSDAYAQHRRDNPIYTDESEADWKYGGVHRIMRGGSWKESLVVTACHNRNGWTAPAERHYNLGFRLVNNP